MKIMKKNKQSWEDLLKRVNENLKGYGAQLSVAIDGDCDNYRLDVEWADGESECYAYNYYESELADVINEAWGEVRCKAKERGDRMIRCIVHIDKTERDGMNSGRFFHEFEICGSEEAALRFSINFTWSGKKGFVFKNGTEMNKL